MAECTPNFRAAYDAAETTPRSFGLPPTTTGLPLSVGSRSSSTETKKASMSTWKMVRCMELLCRTSVELSRLLNEKVCIQKTMRYLALATDYDGTLAADGRVAESTLRFVEELRDSGRRVILVTGRELDDLQNVFSRLELFDCVVAENGALLFDPRTKRTRVLA